MHVHWMMETMSLAKPLSFLARAAQSLAGPGLTSLDGLGFLFLLYHLLLPDAASICCLISTARSARLGSVSHNGPWTCGQGAGP